MPEECAVCDGAFAFSNTVHILIHTQSDEGVIDLSVCKPCYQAELEPIISDEEVE